MTRETFVLLATLMALATLIVLRSISAGEQVTTYAEGFKQATGVMR